MKHIKQVTHFFISSSLGFLINLSTLYFLTEFLGLYYILSAVFAFIDSHLFSFYFNRKITFKSKARIHYQWIKFLIVNLSALGLNIALLYLFTDYLHIYYLLSQIIASAITFFLNFFFAKYWTFSDAL